MFHLFAACVRPFCRSGRLALSYRDLAEVELGDGEGVLNGIRFETLGTLFRILTRPELAIGETYMSEGWKVSWGDLAGLMGILLRIEARIEESTAARAILVTYDALTAPFRRNNTRRSRRNAAHHYDIGNDLYRAFLDDDMVYSCAFFSREAQSLEAAQRDKLEVSLDRLGVEAGMEVLDIGCGWGAMTRAASRRGARAVGITLADRQLALAEELVPPELEDRLEYHLQDYRHHANENPGRYDRVVSIGMLEHVGTRYFADYFDAVHRLLKPGGRALIHAIVKPTRSRTNPWIDKYIFPGGFIPLTVNMVAAAKASGLSLPSKPFEHKGKHYANTVRHWRQRFEAAFPSLDHGRYDERFRRMWNFYLAGSQAVFETLGFEVTQLLLERPR